MINKNRIYLIIFVLALLASLQASISYALLNIFIPEEHLPLELGIAKTFGEQGAHIINIIIDTLLWSMLFLLNYYIYKNLKIKRVIIFFIISLIFWIVGTYIWMLVEVFFLHSFKLNLFGSSCSGTGFPFLKNTCYENILYAFYYLTIFFWFLIIWFIWEQIIVRFFHFLNEHTPSKYSI